MRRLALLLAVLLLVPVLVTASPEPAGAACAAPGTKQLAGTVQGEDGRYLSSLIGIELYDAHQRKLHMDGCLMTEAGYSVVATTNLRSTCCFLLPAEGSVEPTYNGHALTKDWKVTGIPSNAVTVWIEVYPKKCCVPAGTTNTDDSRYGRALRRPITLPATSVDVPLPLRCGLSGGGVSGRTGSISGRIFDNGRLVSTTRVGAWSQEPDTEAKILGWGLHGNGPGSYDLEALAPGRYSLIASANGYSRHVYGVQVVACQTTTIDLAVRGADPPPAAPVVGDWDGDGDDEPGSFRAGTWHLRSGADADGTVAEDFTYGVQAGDVPVAGDWDGDGSDDVGVFRRGVWYLRSSDTGQTLRTVPYGASPGDRPVVGDWNGDGTDDLGIFRSGGTWHLRRSNGTTMPVITYGQNAGDRPVVGDWDGDHDDEPGVFRSGGGWHLRASAAASSATLRTVTYGTTAGDRPVSGDWTGAGPTSIGIVRSSIWNLRSSTGPSGSTIATFPFSA